MHVHSSPAHESRQASKQAACFSPLPGPSSPALLLLAPAQEKLSANTERIVYLEHLSCDQAADKPVSLPLPWVLIGCAPFWSGLGLGATPGVGLGLGRRARLEFLTNDVRTEKTSGRAVLRLGRARRQRNQDPIY